MIGVFLSLRCPSAPRFPADFQRSVCRTVHTRLTPTGSQHSPTAAWALRHPRPLWRPPSPPGLKCPYDHSLFGRAAHRPRHGPNHSHSGPSRSREPRPRAPTAAAVSDQPPPSRPGTLPSPTCPLLLPRTTTPPRQTMPATGPPPTRRRAHPNTDTAPSFPPHRATMPS